MVNASDRNSVVSSRCKVDVDALFPISFHRIEIHISGVCNVHFNRARMLMNSICIARSAGSNSGSSEHLLYPISDI